MLGLCVQVYCDYIHIFSKAREEHLLHERMVLETLLHHKLYAEASKCRFGRSSVGFLGHVISERCVAVDPRKVVGDAEVVHGRAPLPWPRHTNCCRMFVVRFSETPPLQLRSRPSAAPMPSSRAAQPSSRISTRSKRR